MKCREVREYLSTDFWDNRIDSRKMSDINRHVSTCGSCKAFLDHVKSTAVYFDDLKKAEDVPDFIWQNIKTEIQSSHKKRFGISIPVIFPGNWFITATGGVLVLLLVMFSFINIHNYYIEQNAERVLKSYVLFLNDLSSDSFFDEEISFL